MTKFKIGDKIKSNDYTDCDVIHTVIDLKVNKIKHYILDFGGGRIAICDTSNVDKNFSLVEEKPKFKVGDLVQNIEIKAPFIILDVGKLYYTYQHETYTEVAALIKEVDEVCELVPLVFGRS